MRALKFSIVMSTLLLTGCWSSFEVDDRAFVYAMYIDKAPDDNFEVTLSFPLPHRLIPTGIGSSAGNPYAKSIGVGKTITDAFHKIQADMPENISWGHARVIVIGEEMARKGVGPILEFVAREPRFNINNAVLVAPGKASEIENLAAVFEVFPSEIIRKFAQEKITLYTTPKDFLETENGDMIVSFLTKQKRKLLSERDKEQMWVGTGGMALFHNFKMVGELTPWEGRGALWLRNNINQASVTIPSPSDEKPISLLDLQAKTKIRPSKKELYTFDVTVTAEGVISESHSNLDLTKPQNLAKAEQIASREVKDRIKKAFYATKKVKADVFQFGAYLSWYKPKVWKKIKADWPTIYQDRVKLNIHVDFKINRPGSETNPIRIKDISS